MALFSERYGYTKPREALQIEDIDASLKNGLWNVLKLLLLDILKNKGVLKEYYITLWINFYKKEVETIPTSPRGNYYEQGVLDEIREWYINAKWYEVYNFIEFSINTNVTEKRGFRNTLIESFNSILKRENSGYRVINNLVTPISNETEIESLEEAIDNTENNTLKSVNLHLKDALNKLSNRDKPDYRNSIKESISAVEGLVNIINGDKRGTLSSAIKKLKTKIEIHQALEEGFIKIYSYTSDSSGIRHALKDKNDCDFDDAKYMLVSCSAFVNYLIGKANKVGILTNG